jgi:hypothetical protein
MHNSVSEEFNRICRERGARGRVLEIGAVPEDSSPLFLEGLAGTTERVGVNLKGPFQHRGFPILKGNANRLEFEDGRFDTILCNAMLEHDRFFWLTLAELYRVAAVGALIVIGTPGFAPSGITRLQNRLESSSWLRPVSRLRLVESLLSATLTFRVHEDPGDYYRFSLETFREVFFGGCRDVQVRSMLCPPRLIGSGFKSAAGPFPA